MGATSWLAILRAQTKRCRVDEQIDLAGPWAAHCDSCFWIPFLDLVRKFFRLGYCPVGQVQLGCPFHGALDRRRPSRAAGAKDHDAVFLKVETENLPQSRH